MQVIILAGGKGTRLPSSAKDKPKCLVEVNGKPILRHQLDFLAMHGLTDIRLSLGFRAEQVIEYLKMFHPVRSRAMSDAIAERRRKSASPSCAHGSRDTAELLTGFHVKHPGRSIDYVIEDKPLGTGGAIKFASHDLKDGFMVLNGDIFANADLKGFIRRHKELTRQKKILGSILAVHMPDARDFGLIKHKNGLIEEFLEKPEKKQPGHINAGVYILNKKAFHNVSRETFSIEHDVFPDLAKQGLLGVYLYSGDWTDLGTEERLQNVSPRLENLFDL